MVYFGPSYYKNSALQYLEIKPAKMCSTCDRKFSDVVIAACDCDVRCESTVECSAMDVIEVILLQWFNSDFT